MPGLPPNASPPFAPVHRPFSLTLLPLRPFLPSSIIAISSVKPSSRPARPLLGKTTKAPAVFSDLHPPLLTRPLPFLLGLAREKAPLPLTGSSFRCSP